MAALVDENNQKITDCVYTNFIRYNKDKTVYSRGKINAFDGFSYFLAQRENQNWYVLDSIGEEVSGVLLLDQDYNNFKFRRVADSIIQIEYGRRAYVFFEEDKRIDGPFMPNWRSPGCIQRHPMPIENIIYQYRPDSSFVVFNHSGEVIIDSPDITEVDRLSDIGFSTKSGDGTLQLRDTDGDIFFEGGYEQAQYNSSYDVITLSNMVYDRDTKDQSKQAYVDVNGNMLLDTLYNTVYPVPSDILIRRYFDFYAAHIDEKYALLDSNFNVVLESEAKIQVYFRDIFSIENNTNTINVFKGDTSHVLFHNLDYYGISGRNHLVQSDGKYRLISIETMEEKVSYPHIASMHIRDANYLVESGDGHKGFLDENGQLLHSIKADSVFKVKVENHLVREEIRDSLIGFRLDGEFGIYDLVNKKALAVSSDKPIHISKCASISIISKNGKKGIYHHPSGNTVEPRFSQVYVTQSHLPRDTMYFDYYVQGVYNKGKGADRYFVKGDKLTDAESLKSSVDNYKPNFGTRIEDGKYFLYDERTRLLLLPEGYERIELIIDEDKRFRYSNVKSKIPKYIKLKNQHSVQYLNNKLEILGPKKDQWSKAFSFKERHLIDVKGDNRKNGLFNLEAQKYIYPLIYSSIRTLTSNRLYVSHEGGTALADIDGNILTEFKYKHIESEADSPYFIAHTKDNLQVIINENGEEVLDAHFFDIIPSVTVNGVDTSYLFSVRSTELDASYTLINDKGQNLMTLPAGLFYKPLDGPLDMIVELNPTEERKPEVYYFVEDLSIEPVGSKGMTVTDRGILHYVYEIDDRYYYQLLSTDHTIIYDDQAEVLIKAAPKYSIDYRSLDKFTSWKNVIPMHIDWRKEAKYLYNMDGELLLPEYTQSRQNSFGQMEFYNGNDRHFLDPIN